MTVVYKMTNIGIDHISLSSV